MSDVIIPYEFLCKGGTAAALSAWNGRPRSRQLVVETDTGLMKLGDGSTTYNSLDYVNLGTSPTADQIAIDDAGGYFTGTDVEAALQELGSGIGAGGAWTTVKKTSDETRSSSSSLADDAALKFSVVAGVRYAVRLVAKYVIANATMDFKYSPALTTAFTEEYTYRKQHAPAAAGGTDNLGTQVSTGIINASVAVVGTATGQGCIELEMTFKATASGTFSFQWAQNTSDAGNLTVLAGSYLEYMSS